MASLKLHMIVFYVFYAATGHIYRDTEIQTVIHTDHIIFVFGSSNEGT